LQLVSFSVLQFLLLFVLFAFALYTLFWFFTTAFVVIYLLAPLLLRCTLQNNNNNRGRRPSDTWPLGESPQMSSGIAGEMPPKTQHPG